MEKRYSQYTSQQLHQEISELTEKARKAEQMGMVNEYAVYQRKILMAKAYMMDTSAFKRGEVYEVEGDPGVRFKIDYMNGIFAWGSRIDQAGNSISEEEEEALPISLLGEKVTG
ncbi:YfhH family protein [Salirhabdus salicampi]|uniref:YfhH family protein n=1 Tax=Salirhabdus salicampi TaxID=476102 RepID=UPI0020C4159C|nr:YfhH family protein [Salirhabdus salicampi]MCP8617961.1 YfhH family protein [Salirhabdus salicampi]